MQLYSEGNNYKLFQGDMLDLLEVIDENSIDAVLTDPPYELNFMGKGWDNSGIAFRKDTWEKCLKALKPGGYLLAFGGSRTYHRIACAIEDAGFEIRDCIMWLYGSGMPKSLNLGLAIDKKNGVESIDTGIQSPNARPNCNKTNTLYESGTVGKKFTIKKATNERAGWGTALKPSYEIAILAKKPYDIEAYIFVGVINVLDCLNNKGWLKLNAKTAEKFSGFLLVKQNIEEDIALKNVGKNIFTNEDLLGVMDMLQSLGTENTNLSIVSLCLSFLAEICCQLSKYTTEIKINLITELKILKSLLVHDTLANTIQNKEMNQIDIKQSVLTVENFLTEELQKLSYINTHFVQENVISNERKSNLRPSYEPIIVARKPCEGSCTDNVIKYGVGGINIDECRVGTEERTQFSGRSQSKSTVYSEFPQENAHYETVTGRFPANTILTYGDDDREEVCSGFPNTKSSGKPFKAADYSEKETATNFTRGDFKPYNDEGSAARYFYCAKASRRDRDEGLPNKRLNDIDFILLFGDKEIWKGTSTIKGGSKALYDMDTSLKRAIEECEMLKAKGIEWNTILYGRSIIERYLNECKSTTEMKISSTTIYQILNWLHHLNTREDTLDAKKYDELYTSHVESAENGSLLTLTIKEKTELAHDAENAVLKMQLRIREKEGRNEHCTVKPTSLMQYLVRLVTPNGGTVLDPFNGSGSTGKAVMYENKDRNKGYKYIGIELTEEYLPISKARIEYVTKQDDNKEQPPILFSDFAGYDEKNFTD